MDAITRGDAATRTITVLDGTGAAVDLTAVTLKFTAKRRASDAQAAAVIAKSTGAGIVNQTQSGATLGKATLTILSADTASLEAYRVDLHYDIEATISGYFEDCAKKELVIEGEFGSFVY